MYFPEYCFNLKHSSTIALIGQELQAAIWPDTFWQTGKVDTVHFVCGCLDFELT